MPTLQDQQRLRAILKTPTKVTEDGRVEDLSGRPAAREGSGHDSRARFSEDDDNILRSHIARAQVQGVQGDRFKIFRDLERVVRNRL